VRWTLVDTPLADCCAGCRFRGVLAGKDVTLALPAAVLGSYMADNRHAGLPSP
jgi:hypothetical protein